MSRIYLLRTTTPSVSGKERVSRPVVPGESDFSVGCVVSSKDSPHPEKGIALQGGGGSRSERGLVLVPYLTATSPPSSHFSLETAVGGGRIKVQFPFRGRSLEEEEEKTHEDGTQEQDGKRKAITEFSQGSARRLRDLISSLLTQSVAKAYFVTLTYPGEFPPADDHEVYKAHLDAIGKRLVRYQSNLSDVWRLEFQARGAPHYHLLLFGLEPEKLEEFRGWISRAWFEVVGSQDLRHLAAGTNVQAIKSPKAAQWYIASYAAKKDQTMPGNFTGRYWGKHNVSALPLAPIETDDFSHRQALSVQRWMRKMVAVRVNTARMKGALRESLFGEDWSTNEVHFTAPGKRSLEHHLGGKRMPHPYAENRTIVTLPNVSWQDRSDVPYGFKFPRKYKSRHNQSLTMYGDADAIRSQILRALDVCPAFEVVEHIGPVRPEHSQAFFAPQALNRNRGAALAGNPVFPGKLAILRVSKAPTLFPLEEFAFSPTLNLLAVPQDTISLSGEVG